MTIDETIRAAAEEIARMDPPTTLALLDEIERLRGIVTRHPLADAIADMTRLRRLLWLRHGCPITALYGDDGEMQCNGCIIDFKRLPAEEIEARFVRLSAESARKDTPNA